MMSANRYAVIAALCLAAACPVQADNLSELQSLISWSNDPLMNTYELAFFLATHGYSATPEDGYVSVILDQQTYHLIPNGENPGLADVHLIQPSGSKGHVGA